MIKISNLNKVFGKQKVLKNINLNLPRKGLVVIAGPSGCGKSTLLNCIAGLIEFVGSINLDGIDINDLSDNDKSSLRVKDIGFVYQDYKLFNNEDIKSNISLPFCVLFGTDSSLIKRKCIDVLEAVSLEKPLETKVNQLSGGQKQKVAIARAIINNPKVLLCDEPTGSLDAKNKVEIMNVLKKISTSSLVLVVSHDVELARRFCDRLISMKDGEIIDDTSIKTDIKSSNLLVKKNTKYLKKEKLPFQFLIKHIFSIIKTKKVRSSISLMAMSLGLVGFGFSLTLSSIVSENIKSTYSQVIEEDRIVIQKREEQISQSTRKAILFEDALKLKNEYGDYISDVGVNYIADFDTFFETTNEAFLHETNYKYVLYGLNARSINEFRWLDFCESEIYPYDYKKITNSEVILSLTIDMINSICYEYRIERSVESLRDYLKNNTIPIEFCFENLNWQYCDSVIVQMVGFTLEDRCAIYHSNHLWNKFIFCDFLRFPTSNNVTGVLSKPWFLREIPYLFANDNRDTFLDTTLETPFLSQYIFDLGNKNYFPYCDLNPTNNYKNRILVFENNSSGIEPIYSKLLSNSFPDLSQCIFGSYSGYFIYPDLMLMGFSNFTYFASDELLLDRLIDDSSYVESSSNSFFNLPENVEVGHYSQSDEGVGFLPLDLNDDFSGNYPKTYKEIVISNTLAKALFNTEDIVNKEIYVAMVVGEQSLGENNVLREFKKTTLKIVGVKSDKRLMLFHNTNWSILFFMTQFDISSFTLQCNTLSLKLPDTDSKIAFINEFNSNSSHFPQLIAMDPMANFTTGLDEVCLYLQLALIVFSTVAIIVSILLLSMTNYLFTIENKKDFGFLRCLGLTKWESFKLLLSNSLLYGFIAFIISVFELMLLSVVVGFELSIILGSDFFLHISPFSILLMFALTFIISFVSSFVFSRKICNLDPIEALKS